MVWFQVNTPYLMSKLLTLGRFQPHASHYVDLKCNWVTKCLPCEAAGFARLCVCEQENIFS